MNSKKLLLCCLLLSFGLVCTLQAAPRGRSLFVGNFENVTSYRMAVLDVALSLDGALRIGNSMRERPVEADPKAPPKHVFKTIVTIPKEKSAKWIEILRGFHPSKLMLIVPKNEAEEPYLIIMRTQ